MRAVIAPNKARAIWAVKECAIVNSVINQKTNEKFHTVFRGSKSFFIMSLFIDSFGKILQPFLTYNACI